MAVASKLQCAGLSDTGLARKQNEDRIHVDPDRGIFIVADGLGGHVAGERAAQTAIDMIVARLQRQTGTTEERIREAIAVANNEINSQAKQNPQWKGMASVVTLAVVEDEQVTAGHVGDSRMYRCRAGKLEQVTQDHSLMQELVARGFYTPEEAQRAAAKNYVTRALGVEPNVEVDVKVVPVEKDDLFLLCSDGLSDMVEDDDIQLTINTFGANLETLAKQLVLLSNDNGGRDNISVVLVRALDAFPARRGVIQRIIGLFG